MSSPVVIDCCTILMESRRIINAHSRHFLALALIFILPLSFLLIYLPTIKNTIISDLTHPETFLLSDYLPTELPNSIFPVIFCCALATLILTLCATATVSHSIVHGFFGRPVKIMMTITASLATLWRLLFTFLCVQSIILAISVLIGSTTFLLLRAISQLGFCNLSPGIGISGALIVLGIVLIILHVNWGIALIVVIAESNWGLEPLRRSSDLLRGFRVLVFKLLLFFLIGMGAIIWISNIDFGDRSAFYTKDLPIFQNIFGSAVIMLLVVYGIASHTVLYMYCKALHGELAAEIVDEFGRDYISLPFDDQKVPFLVSYVK